MSERYISVETAVALAMQYCPDDDGACSKAGQDLRELLDDLENTAPADVRPVPAGGIGEMSDGYHTFNGLYYQRMLLFAALVKQNKDSAWKSHRHEDGELCFGGGWFIVGIDTPDGSYTYHYEDKDWDLFDCEELPVCKHWDGHTEDDVTRLLSLPDVRPAWRSTETDLPKIGEPVLIARKIRHNETVLVEPAVLRPDGNWKAIGHKIKSSSVRYWMPMPEPPKESEI